MQTEKGLRWFGMLDREKVIKGLELCANGEPCIGEKFMKCPFSPRSNAEQNCGVTMARNAIALLKEQEAVEPGVDIDTWKCGNCGHTLEHQELLGDNVLFHEQYNYCPNCGKAVKWNGHQRD